MTGTDGDGTRVDLRVLVIDNYDSYTYNLVQALAVLTSRPPLIARNDECSWDELESESFDCVVVSPGPGRPQRSSDLGISADAVLRSRLPLLGVCLGHQAIAYLHGGTIVEAADIVHGGRSPVVHDCDELFDLIPSGFEAVRYHSLIVKDLPAVLEATAWTPDGVLMALRHRTKTQWGVQFHPESVATEHGVQLLKNFLVLAARFTPNARAPRPRETPHPDDTPVSPRRQHVAVHRARPLRLFIRTIPAEASPEAIFRDLCGSARTCFWLDSSRPEPATARFSYLGRLDGPRSSIVRYSVRDQRLILSQPGRTLHLRESIFDYLERTLAATSLEPESDVPWDFHGGLVGYLGYETKAELGARAAHESPYPDAAFFFVDRFVVIDHEQEALHLVAVDDERSSQSAAAWLRQTEAVIEQASRRHLPRPPNEGRASPFVPDLDAEAYLTAIAACQEELRRGESYEICLTTQLRGSCNVASLDLYSVLRRVNPAPYAAFLRIGPVSVLCSSPERFVKVNRDRCVETKPIKGTAPRSPDPVTDAAAAAALPESAKTMAENLMITDVLRNDLGRVAEVGTVEVPVFLGVETYATLHQLVSTVRARLRADRSVVDCLRAMFPGGSMTGAPRLRTMEIIDRIEPAARGIYSGTLGYLSLSGTADLNIVIRTIVCRGRDLAIGVGGAITIDSEPQEELEEAILKARALLTSIEIATGAGPLLQSVKECVGAAAEPSLGVVEAAR